MSYEMFAVFQLELLVPTYEMFAMFQLELLAGRESMSYESKFMRCVQELELLAGKRKYVL